MAIKLNQNRSRPNRAESSFVSVGSSDGSSQACFLDLLARMTPGDRRVVAAVVGRVADVEARCGQAAALALIDDIEAVIRSQEPAG
jgi:hypothetical protein